MQYLLTLYVDESGWGRMTTEQQQQGGAAYTAYVGACGGRPHWIRVMGRRR
jgi:hypothetical protein